jgi:hypothetical protein
LPGLSSRFFRVAFLNLEAVMYPFFHIACSTSFRRARAARGLTIGSKTVGACGRPASSAACTSVSWSALLEK